MGLLMALLVDRRLKGYGLYRFLYFWPYAIAAPAVGLAFRFIFAPEAGFVSAINTFYPNLWNPALKGGDALGLRAAWHMLSTACSLFSRPPRCEMNCATSVCPVRMASSSGLQPHRYPIPHEYAHPGDKGCRQAYRRSEPQLPVSLGHVELSKFLWL
jgi:hypothetical protein